MEHVTLKAEDGMEIHGLYREADAAQAAVLLLHMMPATKESWNAFADALRERGLTSLAIDERGHGESVMKDGVHIDYRDFTDEEQQAKRLDVEAAVTWLMERTGFGRERIAVVGASIGANLTIRYLFEHPECPAGIALSPGLDYRGVLTPDAVEGLGADQALLLGVSDEDTASAASVHELETLASDGNVEGRHLEGMGHGTTMFDRDPAFMSECLEWLRGRL